MLAMHKVLNEQHTRLGLSHKVTVQAGYATLHLVCCDTAVGVVTPAVEATTGMATAYNPRISIQPFATPGQRCFVGSYGSPSIQDSLSKSWGGRQ